MALVGPSTASKRSRRSDTYILSRKTICVQALCALKEHGAVYGQGIGRQGQSYAIPTKDADLRTLPLRMIALYVADFLAYAREHPDLEFQVTAIGTGLAGYRDCDIAPMFRDAPNNCEMPEGWNKG